LTLAQGFIELDKTKQDLKQFDCGKQSMNEFFYRFADKHMKIGVSRTWVLTVSSQTQAETNSQVAAYFSLTFNSVYKEEIPSTTSLPNYPVPVVLIARLAVDKAFQGHGLGAKTLISALRKSVELTTTGLPAIGIILDVLDEDALKFYQQFDDFKPFINDPMRLFIPMNVAKQL